MYTNLPISHGYIFRILQHFAPKLCHFTNFGMLFHAIVMNCMYYFELLSIRPIVHTSNFSCAEPNVNEQSSLFELICIRFDAWKVRRLNWALCNWSLAGQICFYGRWSDLLPRLCTGEIIISFSYHSRSRSLPFWLAVVVLSLKWLRLDVSLLTAKI